MLPGAGLGDHPALPHPPRQQRLTDRVVDLVGAGVGEVLPLQVDATPDSFGEALRQIQRRGPTHVVPQQRAELALERLVHTRLRPGGAELVQGGDQRLRNESTPVGAEPLLDRSCAHRLAPRDDMRGCSERSEE